MNIEDVVNYVNDSPANTNENVLRSMLANLGSGVEPVEVTITRQDLNVSVTLYYYDVDGKYIEYEVEKNVETQKILIHPLSMIASNYNDGTSYYNNNVSLNRARFVDDENIEYSIVPQMRNLNQDFVNPTIYIEARE